MYRPHCFWALNVDPGVAVLIPPSPHDLRVSTATLKLGEGMNYQSTAVNILPTSSTPDYRALSAREGYTFCVLTPGRVEQVTLDLWLPAGQGYVVECMGPNFVSLLGYYAVTDCRVDAAGVDAVGKQVARDRKAGELLVHSEAAQHSASRKRARHESPANDAVESNEIHRQLAHVPNGQQLKAIHAGDPQAVANSVTGADPVKMEVVQLRGNEPMVTASDISLRAPVFNRLPINSDVVKEVTAPGEGEISIQWKDRVKLVIEGRVLPNRRLFLVNRDNTPFSVHIGYSTIFVDLQVALLGAKVGSKLTVILPPHRAYGEDGYKPSGVPPNARVQFDITVVSIEKDVPSETTTTRW
ncbi:hypothetical protein FOMPIDRAFT_1056696 [Fomitopsis schrenkii]|uniref:peptidylprolyl isomerase n=1 Tax=Fomitopsis schrenkii TaxID=2126942 RepID=S8DMR8_FOMSC|nr:hypothetical protein FOMPIDRAFT_1056696 [Fomitopsis schrenkii]